MKIWIKYTLIGAITLVVSGGATYGIRRWAYSHGTNEIQKGGALNIEKGLKHIKLAQALGDRGAASLLGLVYSYGLWGVPKDQAEAVKWIRKAADLGNAADQALIGSFYRDGKGVPKDYAEAMRWYRKAADQGNADAQFHLGGFYLAGQGVPENYPEAMKWYLKSAELKNSDAQNNLGLMYRHGMGVPKNPSEAANWFQKAAEQGNPEGQCNLGVLYEEGEGVPKDPMEAVKWYRKAAEQGSMRGQRLLGFLFLGGKSVPRDVAEAEKWFQMAADQGDSKAKSMLELCKQIAAPQENPIRVQGLGVVNDSGYPRIRGIVRNLASQPVDAHIEMELVRSDGVVVDQFSKTCYGMPPGSGQLIDIAIAPYYATARVRVRNVEFR